MEEKELKTSVGQRIVISLIAVLMLGSMIASYALIVVNGNKDTSGSGDVNVDEALVAELEQKYSAVEAKFKDSTRADYNEFIKFKPEVKAYNEAAANGGGIAKRDLKVGTGRELAEGDSDYYAYYIGWCADESVFDSSFDDNKNPSGFAKILDASLGMIEGWNVGVVGMRMDGVREVTISSELAYGDKMEICGGYNKPLKFLIMVKEKTAELKALAAELDDAFMRLQYAQYGINYDEIKGME